MLLETGRPASPPGRVRGRREKHAQDDGHSIPIGASVKTKLPAVSMDGSLCLDFDFEFLTQSGSFWPLPVRKVRKGDRK